MLLLFVASMLLLSVYAHIKNKAHAFNIYLENHTLSVMLCYVMLCYVMLCYVMLCYVMLCYVMLCYVMLCYMLCYVMLCYVMLCYVMLCYVMLCYVMLCYVMLCYVMTCSSVHFIFTNSETSKALFSMLYVNSKKVVFQSCCHAVNVVWLSFCCKYPEKNCIVF